MVEACQFENKNKQSCLKYINSRKSFQIAILGILMIIIGDRSGITPRISLNNYKPTIINSGKKQLDNQIFKFHHKYGIKIMLNGISELMREKFNIDYISRKDSQEAYSKFLSMCEKFPGFIFKKSNINNIYLLDDMKDRKTGQRMGGLFYRNDLYLNFYGTNYLLFFHEFFHSLDNADGFSIDNPIWLKLNNTNFQVKKFRVGNANFDGNLNDEIPGFARRYGKYYGPNEDQGTIGEQMLRNTKKLRRILLRCKSDIVLRNKVQVLTGCVYNPKTMIFDRMMNLEEYKVLSGYDSFEFFPKRSCDDDGLIWMDDKYWNALAKGRQVKFLEVNGVTKRIII